MENIHKLVQQSAVHSLVPALCELAHTQGALFRYVENGRVEIDHVPFAVLPYKLSEKHHLKLQKVHYLWCKLIHNLALDPQAINEMLVSSVATDSFVERLLHIYNETQNICPQNHYFHIIRNDYMIDQKSDRPQMIEFNTISVSLSSLSQKIQGVLRLCIPNLIPTLKPDKMLTSNNLESIWPHLAKAIQNAGLEGIVVMICNGYQATLYDQRLIEFNLLKAGLRVVRATFQDLYQGLKLEVNTNYAVYKEQKVSCFYYRTGYTPNDYNENAWTVRKAIEMSNAIKIPNVAYQLINFKKVQAQLAKPEVVSRYLSSTQTSDLLETVADMWSFDDESKHQEILRLSEEPDFVMKPNREGGGNNIYGQNVLKTLKSLSPKERKAYILMRRIHPERQTNYFVRRGRVQKNESITEHSTYGILYAVGDQIKQNLLTGYLDRIKSYTADEGGMMTGISVLGSAYIS